MASQLLDQLIKKIDMEKGEKQKLTKRQIEKQPIEEPNPAPKKRGRPRKIIEEAKPEPEQEPKPEPEQEPESKPEPKRGRPRKLIKEEDKPGVLLKTKPGVLLKTKPEEEMYVIQAGPGRPQTGQIKLKKIKEKYPDQAFDAIFNKSKQNIVKYFKKTDPEFLEKSSNYLQRNPNKIPILKEALINREEFNLKNIEYVVEKEDTQIIEDIGIEKVQNFLNEKFLDGKITEDEFKKYKTIIDEKIGRKIGEKQKYSLKKIDQQKKPKQKAVITSS
jgi:hypothetical protein